jgi:hypothetical protein
MGANNRRCICWPFYTFACCRSGPLALLFAKRPLASPISLVCLFFSMISFVVSFSIDIYKTLYFQNGPIRSLVFKALSSGILLALRSRLHRNMARSKMCANHRRYSFLYWDNDSTRSSANLYRCRMWSCVCRLFY